MELVHALAASKAIVPTPLRAERVTTGFPFTEGPVWTSDGVQFGDVHQREVVPFAQWCIVGFAN